MSSIASSIVSRVYHEGAMNTLRSRVAALEALLERCLPHVIGRSNNDQLAAEIRTALKEKK